MESRSVVETYYERLAARDRDGLLEILDPGVVVTYHAGTGVFPWSGRFEGIDGFDAFFAAIAEHLEIIEVVQLAWITDANSVVVQCDGQWRVKANGAVVAGSMVNIFGVADGRVSSYDVHADTAAFLQGMIA